MSQLCSFFYHWGSPSLCYLSLFWGYKAVSCQLERALAQGPWQSPSAPLPALGSPAAAAPRPSRPLRRAGARIADLSFLRVSLHFSAPLPHQWILHDFVQMPMFIFSSFWRAERGDPAPVVAPGISHLYNSISFRGINLGGTSL